MKNMNGNMKVMVIVAHQDDFEFSMGGYANRLKGYYGDKLKLKIFATTRGASGHHEMETEDTYKRREQEALKSAAIIGAEYECLKGLDGVSLPGQVFLDRNTLGGLWNAVRNFEPDFIFCPPVPSDPLRGVHIDHYNTACAVRLTAYQFKVPNAYPSLNTPIKRKLICPIIINLDDNYISDDDYHISVDISSVYEKKLQMLLCHESQVLEWLPWTNGSTRKIAEEEFVKNLHKRHDSTNRVHGKCDNIPREYFCITQWSKTATMDDIKKIFPFGKIQGSVKKYIK